MLIPNESLVQAGSTTRLPVASTSAHPTHKPPPHRITCRHIRYHHKKPTSSCALYVSRHPSHCQTKSNPCQDAPPPKVVPDMLVPLADHWPQAHRDRLQYGHQLQACLASLLHGSTPSMSHKDYMQTYPYPHRDLPHPCTTYSIALPTTAGKATT